MNDLLAFEKHKGRSIIAFLAAFGVLFATWGSTMVGYADDLAILREDVRGEAQENDSPENNQPQHGQEEKGPLDEVVSSAMASLGGMIVLSPFWFPRAITNDEGAEGYFPNYPYRHGSGYMMIQELTEPSYRWSARFRSDYAEDFDGLSRVGGHLLLSTTSRWGLDTEMNYLQERLPERERDHLWLGDCNILYRFAQSERSQWRAGMGLNWLDDSAQTDFGFNFTYGFDLYPRKPFVLSTEIDWGNLGSAEAFHFRTTAGALIRGLETYVGYEYRDIDHFYFNGLIAGVRVWF